VTDTVKTAAFFWVIIPISFAGGFDGLNLLSGSVEKMLEINQFKISDNIDPDTVGLPRNFVIDFEEKKCARQMIV
jgi:hypothetical protein